VKKVFLTIFLISVLLFIGNYVLSLAMGPRCGFSFSEPVGIVALELEKEILNYAFPTPMIYNVVEEDICMGGVLDSCILSSGYGPRQHPVFGGVRFHNGIDLAAKSGSSIMAPLDGVVKSVGIRGGYGLAVTVDHGYGWSSIYAHLSGAAVSRGDYVGRGQLIGEVGSTGVSTGPHLHFEIRYGRAPVDPRAYYMTITNFKSLLAWRQGNSENY
jgi:murein DD-endopeptidase MepM/ murein hydrolase activator NlpD